MRFRASLAILLNFSGMAAAETSTLCRPTSGSAGITEPFLVGETAQAAIRYEPPPLASSYVEISRDGSYIAGLDPHADRYTSNRLAVVGLGDGEIRTDLDLGKITFLNLGSTPALRWAADSKSILAVTQEIVRPNGWAISELKPIRVDLDGNAVPMKSIRHEAGTLDGILWLGGEGKALVQLGMKGGYFRPEKQNPTPTYAIADLATGVVLDTLPAADLPIDKNRLDLAHVYDVSATIMPDGKVRAVINLHQVLAVWTQVESFKIVPNPLGEQDWMSESWMQIAPDGRSILLMRPMSRSYTCPRIPSSEPGGGCWEGEPVEGTLAALVDLQSGEVLWRIEARAESRSGYPRPVISADSRLALIALPITKEGHVFAAIDMESGAILQKISMPEDGNGRGGRIVLGFIGNCAWTYGYGVAKFYARNPTWEQ